MVFSMFKRGGAAPAQAAVADPQGSAEARSRAPVNVAQADPGIAQIFNMNAPGSGGAVTIEAALGVPAVWAAVNFLSKTLAAIPIKSYARTDAGRAAQAGDPVAALLNHAATDELTAFDFRRGFWQDVFTAGRGLAFIERNGGGDPINLWPLEVAAVTVARRAGRTLYTYRDGGRSVTYGAGEVLDLSFMPGANRLAARSPIYTHADTVNLALAVTRYGARFFENGGVPSFVITGAFKTPGGLRRAADEMAEAVQDMAAARRNGIALPEGHTISPVGIDPEKMQMIDAQRFLVEQFARIYQMPPAFLWDLTHGTFSNVEQQDLQLVKHVIAPWVSAFENEVNLKLYGRRDRSRYLENSLDGLMRGDLVSRSDALSKKIASGQMTPNEARALDNRGDLPGGDSLLVQGAMVRADSLTDQATGGAGDTGGAAPPDEENADEQA